MAAQSDRYRAVIQTTTFNTVGLVNGGTYGFVYNSQGQVVLSSQITANTPAAVYAAGLTETNGIWQCSPDATQLILCISPGGLTGAAGVSFAITNVFTPLTLGAANTQIISSIATSVAAATPSITRYTLRPTVSDSAASAIARSFYPVITATTWPASAGTITISLEMV